MLCHRFPRAGQSTTEAANTTTSAIPIQRPGEKARMLAGRAQVARKVSETGGHVADPGFGLIASEEARHFAHTLPFAQVQPESVLMR